MTIQERLYTVDDLRDIEALPENKDKLFELIKGVIYEVAYPSPTHNLIVQEIQTSIRSFSKSKKLGFAFTDTVSYRLPNGDEFAPDVSFVSYKRQSLPLPTQFEFAPDMAVEVASPSNRERELHDKAESMLQCGTKFIWIAYPASKIVDVCHVAPDGSLNIRKVGIDGILDGEDVLPGFTLAVKDIFEIDE
ncbi:MAG: Uma2 family endonuclease [Chitinophagaceae bacterium]|nr:Uma2 family endonuclease [Anaerolineae bacterium]